LAQAAKAEAAARKAETEASLHAKAIEDRRKQADQKMSDAESLKRKAEEELDESIDISKISDLNQLHPMFSVDGDLIETAPPAPKTPATTLHAV